jgi:hypothetical protein
MLTILVPPLMKAIFVESYKGKLVLISQGYMMMLKIKLKVILQDRLN